MGIVFGKTGTKEPVMYSLMKITDGALPYEVRQIQTYFVAELDSFESQGKRESEGFRQLAKYIGVFGSPENVKNEVMARTSPVVMNGESAGESMAMTSPVVMNGEGGKSEYMQFVLPFEYTRIEDIPKPLNSKIHVKCIPSRVIAITKFSGWYDSKVGLEKYKKLAGLLKEKGLGGANENLEWSVAQYHPPFTLPFLRRNEVWVELSNSNLEVKKLLQEFEKQKKANE